MPVQFDQIEDKQRIVIVDNEGGPEILEIVIQVLSANDRKFDFWKSDGTYSLSEDAPVILIQADDNVQEGSNKAKFLSYQHHIMVIHHVSDKIPASYASFEDYVAQYEELADKTPKSGTILYNQEDSVANIIAGERERPDIRLVEYAQEDGLSSAESAAKAILRRIGINDELFDKGLATN